MEFATTDLRNRLLTELGQASSAKIAVAYFNPDAGVHAALQKVKDLQLLVADDFQINNPDGLEALSNHGHWVRALSGEAHGGNLHSKVYLIERKNKTLWAMVGSANLTRPGLATNQEACLILDAKKASDVPALNNIRTWIDELFAKDYEEIDFELARAVFEAAGKHASKTKVTSKGGKFWALKPGECGEFWDNFLAESVVAIGWTGMPDTSKMTREKIAKAFRTLWEDAGDGAVNASVAQILKFTQKMSAGDLVFICGRYDKVGKVDKDVYIYGVARLRQVDGKCYFFDPKSSWQRFKRHATIQKIKHKLPRSLVASALGSKSMVPTIQELDASRCIALEELLKKELGIVLEV